MHATATHDACPRCGRSGRVGHLCEHAACARDGVHVIPERFFGRGLRGVDARVGTVVARHLLVERLHRRGVDPLYRALQVPALLEVELALAPIEREQSVHDNLFRQALALARLGAHPNVTRLVTFEAEPTCTVLAVEATRDARPLSEVVSADGNDPIPPAAAKTLLTPLAAVQAALARAHLVHGEIRPENVFVGSEPGYEAYVRLAGFVRIPPADAADPTGPAHDLVWRAPEQILQHAVDDSTDGYAIAAIAFAMLFGRPPFPPGDRARLMELKQDHDYDPTEGLAAAVPADVIYFFQAALEVDPAERFAAEGFPRALGRALDQMIASEGDVGADGDEPDAAPGLAEDGPVPRRKRRDPNVRFHADPDEAPPASAHASSRGTVTLSTSELEDLVEARGTPRMHDGKHR